MNASSMTRTQEIEAYQRDGFLIVRGAVTGEPFKKLERELDRMREDVEIGTLRGNHLMEDNRKARGRYSPGRFIARNSSGTR